jgi:uncharacterized protein involved in exopolysaccharide biosynthesis
MEEMEEGGGESAGGGLQADQLRSYVAFGKHAIKKRWGVSVSVLVGCLTLTVLALKFLPKTFSCSTALMTMGTVVLDGRDGTNALAGASDLIQRQENLEGMIRQTGLVQKWESRRSPLLRLKDRAFAAVFGPMNEKTQIAVLVGTLESKIDVTTEKDDLTIKVQWSDPFTAAELADAARESFVKFRHTAEISAFEEKMTILEGHADKLRDEIGSLAQQLDTARDQKVSAARAEQAGATKASAASPPRMARIIVNHAAEPDAQTPELKAKLESLKSKLASIEADHDSRLRQEQAKLEELKLRLMPSHPEVVTQQQKVAMLSQVPSDVALMRAEEKDLEGELLQRTASGGSVTSTGMMQAQAAPAAADALSPGIADLLQRDDLDPALSAQLSSTVIKYSALRNDLLTTRIELDTAEAAFNHRYQIIIPAEVDMKPDKPKPGVIVGIGLVFSLLLGLALPVLAELRRGIIVERWQVEHLELPILAELRLPPHSPE